MTKESIGWDLKILETAAILVINQEKTHSSNSEFSSSESSTDRSDDGSDSDVSADFDPTGEKVIHKPALNCSEKTDFGGDHVVYGENGAVCKNSGLFDMNSHLVIERNEQDSDGETLRKGEVLPSLLFSNNHGERTLVEVIDDDDDDHVNDVCSSSCENVDFKNSLGCEVIPLDKRKGNKAIDKEKKNSVSSQATDDGSEQEISCRMSGLRIKS